MKRISSIDAVGNKTPSEVGTLVLVHFHKVKLVLVELIGYFLPKAGLTGAQDFPNVRTVFSVVANDISVEFAWYWSGKAPPQKDWVENTHAEEVVAGAS